MKFKDLENRLRRHIRARIDRGELTGIGLSCQAGFQQSHLSNFLHGRRGLSLETIDRLLHTLQIDVLDLIDRGDVERRLPAPAAEEEWETVAVISPTRAARLARFTSRQVEETRGFPRTFLRKLRADDICHRSQWLRFVLIRLDPRASRALFPETAGGGVTLLIDRHYNSLRPYRRREPNLYLVRAGARYFVGQVTLAGGHLVLRPRDSRLPVEMARIEGQSNYSDYLVGRVCHVEFEV